MQSLIVWLKRICVTLVLAVVAVVVLWPFILAVVAFVILLGAGAYLLNAWRRRTAERQFRRQAELESHLEACAPPGPPSVHLLSTR